MIDSDMPSTDGDDPTFTKAEKILVLHDEGERGRLFKTRSW